MKTAPPGVSLPERYPNLRFLDAAQTIELVRLNTVLDDSLPNALALGRVAPEYRQELPPGTSRDPFEEIDSRSSGTALRIAAMHHPPYEVDRGFWAAVSHAFVAPSPGGLLDADAVRRELAARDFDLILCGHEHTRAKTQIFEGGRILQLAVGSPAFRKGRGNHDQPHFALYWLDLLDDAIFLWWAVCTIDVLSKESWSVEQAYCFDRSTRRWETTSPSAMPPLLAELVTAI